MIDLRALFPKRRSGRRAEMATTPPGHDSTGKPLQIAVDDATGTTCLG